MNNIKRISALILSALSPLALAGSPIIWGNDSGQSLQPGHQATETTTLITPPSGSRKLYPKTDGWYDLNSAGTESKFGNVVGPASSTDTAIARFNGTGGKTIQNSVSTLDVDDKLVLGPSAGFNAATKYHLIRGSMVATNTGSTSTGAAYFIGGSAGTVLGANLYQANTNGTTRAVNTGTGFTYAALSPVTSATSNIFEVYGNVTSQTADAATTGTAIRGMALTPAGGVEFGQSTNTSTAAALTVNGYNTGDVVATFWNRYATSNNATIQIKGAGGGVVSFGLDGNGTYNYMSNVYNITPTGGILHPVGINTAGRLGDTTPSRRELKKDFEPLKSPGIFKLPIYKFKWRESGDLDVGGIADEAAIYIPEYTVFDKEGKPTGIRYDKLALGAILAAQELKREIEDLKAEIKSIKKAIKESK